LTNLKYLFSILESYNAPYNDSSNIQCVSSIQDEKSKVSEVSISIWLL